MDATSERSTKSSSSAATRARTRKVRSDSGAKSACVPKSSSGMESTSERATRRTSRTTKKVAAPMELVEHVDQFSFRIEPLVVSPHVSQSTSQFSEQMDMLPIINVSASNESVASENDYTAATPLLLRSCERSESLRQSTAVSTVLSDDILDRLNRSSLSDIEKSGIGVERSIKKAIHNSKKKKLETKSTSIPDIPVHPTAEDRTDADLLLDHSISLENGLLFENVQDFIGDNAESNNTKGNYINSEIMAADEEYIEEEVIDDDFGNLNSSSHLSQVAAEMDEAMTKIWAKLDEKVTKTMIDADMISDTRHNVDPEIHAVLDSEAQTNSIITCDEDNICIDSCHSDLPIASSLGQADEKVITGIVDKDNEIADAVSTSPEFVSLKAPDDARLSSIVKLLVIDAWSTDIDTVKSCLDQMTTLCETDENAATEMFQHGGHLVVLVLMRQHCANASVQIAALMTLQKAAECRNEFTDAIIALGALELIIATMKNHDRNEYVVTAGCGALLNLTLPAKHAKVFVFELFGIQLISHVSSNFPTKIALQKYVLWMLQYFSYWDNYKIQIVQQGGMQTLAKMIESFSAAMINNVNNAVEQSNDTLASSTICNNDTANKAAIESIVKSASATMKRLL